MSTLTTKNKLLNEKLDEQDKTIVALMNTLTRYQEERFKLKHQLRQCEVIANNVLYFDDSSDYSTALWQVLNVAQGKKADDDCYDVKLAYIEEE